MYGLKMGLFLLFALSVGESKSGFWHVVPQALSYQLLNRTGYSVSTGSAWNHEYVSFA